MKFKLQVVAGEGEDAVVHELAILDKDCARLEHVGLALDESKQVLRELQKHIVEHQAASFVDSRALCDHCGSKRRGRGRHSIVFRTLFGNVTLDSPRLRHCKRYRAGLVISTAFVESLVNSLLGKRFTKKQQMQWSRRGAHLLLQTRTRVVNGELGATFRQWYPAMRANDVLPVSLSEAA